MRRFLLVLLLIGFSISIAHAACVGVVVCDTTYSCGVSDGFCPADVGCDCSDPDCLGAGAGAGGVGGIGGAGLILYNCTNNTEYLRIPSTKELEYTSSDFCVDLRWVDFKVENIQNQVTFMIKQETIGNQTCYAFFNLTYYNITDSTLEFRVPRWWLREFKIMPWTINAGDTFIYGRNETEEYYYFRTKDLKESYLVCGDYVDFWRLLDAIDEYYKGKISFTYLLQMLVVYYE